MIGLYLFFKMFFILVVACVWVVIWSAVALFWLVKACFVVTWWLVLAAIAVVSFIVMVVKEVREHREERRLIEA